MKISCARIIPRETSSVKTPKQQNLKKVFRRQLAVAPMLDYTDRHCRFLHRLLSPHAVLYTEMITTSAILKGPRDSLLVFNSSEHPVALQLGGSDPADLEKCAIIGEQYGYDEINLNIGCPSSRVKKGRFGACLMAEPQLVADCISSMITSVNVPITVKTRIGIDDLDSYDHLSQFIQTINQQGCETFIIHARKAWLSGLSPKENREIPPLKYEVVRQLKQDFPELNIIVNGGITSKEQVVEHLNDFDGVMIGRAAYHNPYLLAELGKVVFKEEKIVDRLEVLAAYAVYVENELQKGTPLYCLIRPLLGLFQGQSGARAWRRYLTEEGCKKGTKINFIAEASKILFND